MQTSKQGRELIEAFEGLFLHSYYDSVHVLTIGYGHTNIGNIPPHITPNMVITQEQADEALSTDLGRFEAAVSNIMHGTDLSQPEFDALVSFDFNTGDLASSSIPRLLRANNVEGACAVLMMYNHAGGKVLNGLTRRRKAEVQMMLGNVDRALAIAKQ